MERGMEGKPKEESKAWRKNEDGNEWSKNEEMKEELKEWRNLKPEIGRIEWWHRDVK